MYIGARHIKISKDTWSDGPWQKKAKDDVALWIKTMFPSQDCATFTQAGKHYEEEKQKGEFLQRLFFVLHSAPLKFLSIKGRNENKEMKTWSYPLAMALSHSGRILFKVEGMKVRPLLSWLLTGKLSPNLPPFLKKRVAASHGVSYNEETGEMKEVKLIGIDSVFSNIEAGLLGYHCYVNLSFGGLGSNDGFGNLVTFDGHRFDPVLRKTNADIQHGHCYIHYKDFGQRRGLAEGALLIGVEGSEPSKPNAFGRSHTLMSGFKRSTESKSISGGDKFDLLLGEDAPLPYNGMVVNIDDSNMPKIMSDWDQVSKENIEERQAIMLSILNSPAREIHEVSPTPN